MSESPQDVKRPADASEPGPLATDWKQAEQLAVWHLRQLGYHDAQPTPASGDTGVDVHASGAVAQVKHWTGRPVGQPPLRDLFGVAQATGTKPIFYSLSGYSREALRWACRTKTALFTYTCDGQVVARNAAACDLERNGAQVRRPGFFTQLRADSYQQEQEQLRREIERMTARMQKRTQSRRAKPRLAAGAAARLLDQASRKLDVGELLPPADRRRADVYKEVSNALTRVKRML